MIYRSRRMPPLAVVVAVGVAVAVAGCTEANSRAAAAPDDAESASMMIHSADPSFSTSEKERLREICGLGAPSGPYRSTILCDSAEAADPQVRTIIDRPRSFAGSLDPSVPVATEITPSVNRSVLASIISTNTGVSEGEVKKVLDELDRVNAKNAERARSRNES